MRSVIVVDVQEKLAAAMPPAQRAELTRAATILLEAAAPLLGAPRARDRARYKSGLGPTRSRPIAASASARLGVTPIAMKLRFSVVR